MPKFPMQYDETSDTLTIAFVPETIGITLELTEHILLQLTPETYQPLRLTLLDSSILAQTTLTGFRSFPLKTFFQWPIPLQNAIVSCLEQPPLSEFLRLSTYTPSLSQAIPVISLERSLIITEPVDPALL